MSDYTYKRTHELDPIVDTQGYYTMCDKDGEDEGGLTLYIDHIVSTLPESPIDGHKYYLTSSVGVYPTGLYMYSGSGWVCVQQTESISLSNWSGAVSITLCAGVAYDVTIIGAVSSISLPLTTDGTITIKIANSSLYNITEPIGIYKTTDIGLDDLSVASSRLVIQQWSSEQEWGANAIISSQTTTTTAAAVTTTTTPLITTTTTVPTYNIQYSDNNVIIWDALGSRISYR